MKPSGLFVINRKLNGEKYTSQYYLYSHSQGVILVYLSSDTNSYAPTSAEKLAAITKAVKESRKQPYTEFVNNVLANHNSSSSWQLEKYLTP